MKVKAETRSFYVQAVERAVHQVVCHLDEALDLAALARLAAMSPFHFHRVFRGMLGETPLELRRRLRLERAATRLLDSDTSVTALAFDAGFETHESFTRAFRCAYGLSPSAFRQKGAEARLGCARPLSAEIAAPSGLHLVHLDPSLDRLPLDFLQGELTMDVIIENLPAMRVATVHHVGPYMRISEAFARLGQLAGPAGLVGKPGCKMIGIFHDDPETTPPDELQSDAGLSVPAGLELPTGLSELTLPAGRYAHTTHTGPYDRLPDAWSRFLGQWLPRSGERLGQGASFEVYENTPENTSPAELRTELYLPLA